jgi:hypothetical protein
MNRGKLFRFLQIYLEFHLAWPECGRVFLRGDKAIRAQGDLPRRENMRKRAFLELEIRCSIKLSYGRRRSTDIYRVPPPSESQGTCCVSTEDRLRSNV